MKNQKTNSEKLKEKELKILGQNGQRFKNWQ